MATWRFPRISRLLGSFCGSFLPAGPNLCASSSTGTVCSRSHASFQCAFGTRDGDA